MVVRITFVIVLLFSLFISLAQPKIAMADWKSIDQRCVYEDPKTKEQVATIQGLECLFTLFLQYVVRLAGIATFIMILFGGFQYLAAGDNPENTQKAWGTITWGVGGLAVLLLLWIVLRFIKEFTGIDVTKFLIPDASP